MNGLISKGEMTTIISFHHVSALPKIIIHRFKEEFVIWSIESIFEISQCYTICGNIEFNEVRSVFVIDMIDDFCFLNLLHSGGKPSLLPNLTMVLFVLENGDQFTF